MSAEPGRKKAYSIDLRWRVVWQRLSMDLTYKEIAKNLSIAPSTAHSIFKLFEITGFVDPKTNTGYRREQHKLSDHQELIVIGMVLDCPSVYLNEICQRVKDLTDVSVTESTVCRLLGRHGFTRKKIRQVALQRCTTLRGAFMASALLYKRDQLVWVDETGCDRRDCARKYGYAIRGSTPEYHRLLIRGERISAIAAIAEDGVVTYKLTTGGVDSSVFFDYIRGDLIPQMHQFDGSSTKSVVIMDNCSIHRVPEVQRMFSDCGIVVLFLPPYSPDYNPIEETFSYVKYYLKRHDDVVQSTSNPIPVLKAAFDSIDSVKCNRWIDDCGYA